MTMPQETPMPAIVAPQVLLSSLTKLRCFLQRAQATLYPF